MDYEERVERAVALFNSGFNCSQSVVAAFADMYGFTEEQALRMSASFGAGIGRSAFLDVLWKSSKYVDIFL